MHFTINLVQLWNWDQRKASCFQQGSSVSGRQEMGQWEHEDSVLVLRFFGHRHHPKRYFKISQNIRVPQFSRGALWRGPKRSRRSWAAPGPGSHRGGIGASLICPWGSVSPDMGRGSRVVSVVVICPQKKGCTQGTWAGCRETGAVQGFSLSFHPAPPPLLLPWIWAGSSGNIQRESNFLYWYFKWILINTSWCLFFILLTLMSLLSSMPAAVKCHSCSGILLLLAHS